MRTASLDAQPPSRPADGAIVGCVAGVATTIGIWFVLVAWRFNEAFVTHPWLLAGASINYLAHLLSISPIPVAMPWPSLSVPFQSALAWRILTAIVAGLFAGVTAGVWAGRAGPGVRHIGGRAITCSPHVLRRALQRRERLDGVPLHPRIPVSIERERRHLLIVGGTGSGKTQAILPMLCAARERGDRLLIYDFKGDLTEQFLDDAAVLLAPWDARSAIWNVAQDVPDLPAARELAAALVPLPQANGNPMWANGARQILTGLIRALQSRGDWQLTDLATAAARPIAEVAATLRQHHPEAASLLVDPESPTANSFISTLVAELAGLYDLARDWPNSFADGFSIRNWLNGHGPRVVIVQHAESHRHLARMLLRMMLRLVLQRVGDPGFVRAAAPTWLFMDEFLQAGRLEPLLSIAETARSKDVRLVLACQDVSRLRDVYGREQADALAGLVGTLILGRSRGENAQWASKLAGNQIVLRYSRSCTVADGRAASLQTAWRRSEEPVFRPEDFDSQLGTVGQKRRTKNRLLVLAGGDLIGVLDWPLTILPKIAEAHAAPPENPIISVKAQSAAAPAFEEVLEKASQEWSSLARADTARETTPIEKPRERLRRRRKIAATANSSTCSAPRDL